MCAYIHKNFNDINMRDLCKLNSYYIHFFLRYSSLNKSVKIKIWFLVSIVLSRICLSKQLDSGLCAVCCECWTNLQKSFEYKKECNSYMRSLNPKHTITGHSTKVNCRLRRKIFS